MFPGLLVFFTLAGQAHVMPADTVQAVEVTTVPTFFQHTSGISSAVVDSAFNVLLPLFQEAIAHGRPRQRLNATDVATRLSHQNVPTFFHGAVIEVSGQERTLYVHFPSHDGNLPIISLTEAMGQNNREVETIVELGYFARAGSDRGFVRVQW
ncbi:MAG: hypothetical protein AAB515_02775 [Patescibacteria group bacterium]